MKRRSLLLSLCLVLAIMAATAGTIAFLTDKAMVTNTFTVGKVQITLDEAQVGPDGKPIEGAERVDGNAYHLLPGKVYTKDPTVTVKARSEEAYVRMVLTVTEMANIKAVFGDEGFSLDKWFDASLAPEWILFGTNEDEANNAFVWEFRYKEPVDTSAQDLDEVLEPLFERLRVPEELSVEQLKMLEKMQIIMVAHAIQTESFEDDENMAWAAFDNQNAPVAAPGTGSGSEDETVGGENQEAVNQ